MLPSAPVKINDTQMIYPVFNPLLLFYISTTLSSLLQRFECSQKEFSKYLHSKRHTIIFGKINIKPICNTDTLMPIHMSLDPDFNHLINDQHRKMTSRAICPFVSSFFILLSYQLYKLRATNYKLKRNTILPCIHLSLAIGSS